MSAFKKLNRQDVFVSDYNAKKQWSAEGNLIDGYHIETLRGFSGSTPGYPYPTDYRNNRYESLVWRSSNQNYYTDGIGNGLFSGSFDLSLQTTLTDSGSRDIKSEVGIISFPKTVYGTHIEPNSFSIKPKSVTEFDRFMSGGYAGDVLSGVDQYVEDAGYWYESGPIDIEDYLVSESNYVTESAVGTTPGQFVDIDFNQQRLEIIDDGNGSLIFSGSEKLYTKSREVVGDIVYNQGQVIFSDPVVARYYSTYSRHIIKWKSNQPIYTYNVNCRVKDSELNFTFNPSAITGSDAKVRDNISGSSFNPYITSVGLYNDANELIALAKTNRPIPKPDNVDMTFLVKIDI